MIVSAYKRLHLGKEVVFGQSGCIRAKWLYQDRNDCIRLKWFYSCKVVVFGQKWLCSGKIVVFGESDCIWAKVVFIRAKRLYSGKSSWLLAKWL